MARKAEKNNFLLSFFFCFFCFSYDRSYSMSTFRCRNNTFSTCKDHTCLKALQLRNIYTVHKFITYKLTYNHTSSMISQTTRMYIGWLEIMSKGVHWQKRCITSLISEIIFKLTSRQLRTAFWFGCNKLSCFAIFYIMTHKRKSDTTKVTSTSKTSNNGIRIFTSHFHLLFGFQTNYRLMECYMV